MSPRGMIGFCLLAFFLLIAVLAPILAPYSPLAYSGKPLEPPSQRHWLGTDGTGQDVLSQLLYGSRISLVIGTGAAIGSTFLGAGIGIAAAQYGRSADRLLMRLIDIFLTIPHLPLMLLLAAHFKPQLTTTIAVLIVFSWPAEARLIRAQVLALAQQEYLAAAHLAGATRVYLLRRYILPELAPLLLTQVVVRTGWAVLAEAGLAFLGLGDPAAKSWGMMLKHALDYPLIYFTPAWQWLVLPPGLCITALILALTLAGYELEARERNAAS